MSGTNNLIEGILLCSRVFFYSDRPVYRIPGKPGVLATFIGVAEKDEYQSVFVVRDVGTDITRLVVEQVEVESVPKNLTQVDIFCPTHEFDGPIEETYNSYNSEIGVLRGLSRLGFSELGIRCDITISEDFPTLFEIYSDMMHL